METQTANTAILERKAPPKTVVDTSKHTEKYENEPFKPRPALLLDVLPSESFKTGSLKQTETSQEMLQQLLINTETSAQRTASSKRKWQFLSLLSLLMLVMAVILIGWLYSETSIKSMRQGKLAIENLSLKESVNTANAQISGLKKENETLLSRNIELAGENSKLKPQNNSPVKAASAVTINQKQQPAKQQVTLKTGKTPDSTRLEAIRSGKCPSGATRAEIITAIGEPDRVYQSRGYEQLVYFGKKPGHFWLIGGYLVHVSQ